jgi:hypothetical protein
LVVVTRSSDVCSNTANYAAGSCSDFGVPECPSTAIAPLPASEHFAVDGEREGRGLIAATILAAAGTLAPSTILATAGTVAASTPRAECILAT